MPNPNFKRFWNLVEDNEHADVLNMYVYGEITSSRGLFSDPSDVVTNEFLSDLKEHPNVKVINVFINSPGGDVFAAAALRNQLKQHSATIHTWGDGLIASAAVGLMGAADKGNRHMSNSALMMVHNPSTRASGDEETMLKAAEILSKVKNTLLNMYAEDTGQAKDFLATLMDQVTYLEASEAKDYGFIDDIKEETSEMMIEDNDTFMYNGVSCKFSNYAKPNELKDKLTHLAKVKNGKEGGNVIMTFEQILALLPADQQAIIRDHISASLASANTQNIQDKAAWDTEKASLEGELATARAEIASVQAELTAAQAQLTDIATGTDPADTILDSLPEEAKALVIQSRQAAADAQARLNAIQEEHAYNTFKDSLSVYDALPIQEAHIKALYSAHQADEEGFKALTSLMQVANQAMAAGFVPVGKDNGVPTATNAFDEIEQKIKDMRTANATITYNDAFKAVVSENPDLYNRYREEM